MPQVTRFSPVGKAEYRESIDGLREWRQVYVAQIANNPQADGRPDLRTPENWKDLLQAARPDLKKGAPHPRDPQCFVERFDAIQRSNALIWDITVDWSNRQELPENPLAKPAAIVLNTQFEQLPVVLDKDNRPIVNTAGQLIEGLEEPYPIINFRCSKNIASYPDWLFDYPLATNSDVVRIKGKVCAPRTLKIGALSIGDDQSVTVGNKIIDYMQLNLELLQNAQTWDKVVLNRGTSEITLRSFTNSKGKLVIVRELKPCKDPATGDPVSEPVFLDPDGRRPRVDDAGKLVTLADEIKALKQGQTLQTFIKEPLDPSDIVILKKRIRPEFPFGALPLR